MSVHRDRYSLRRAELLAERAGAMRFLPTVSEQRLWEQLRGRRLGVRFRRQVPLLSRYVVDFLAPVAKVVVEVDGGCHAHRAKADARRDAALQRAGYRVVRVSAEAVMRELGTAVEAVRNALELATRPARSGSGGEL
jgi:very-short-patch-repair endonuclease